MIVHDEAYESRHDADLNIETFCGMQVDGARLTRANMCVLYLDGKPLSLYSGYVIDCEACILIKFQIDSTK